VSPSNKGWFRVLGPACLAIACALSVCAAQRSAAAPGQVGDPPIWDVARERFVTEDELVARLARVRYRLLGEIHDNPEHHALRARLIHRIADSGAKPAVVFEQFELDRDAALVAAQRATQSGSRADVDAVAAAGGITGPGWQWPLHRPLVEAALAERLPLRAGNPQRAELMRAARAPAESVPDASWGKRFAAAPWTPAQDATLRTDVVDGHCGKLPEQAIAAIVRAQRMRDAALAQALVDAATADGAILIAGNAHIRRDVAVPIYVQPNGVRPDDAALISVGFIEATPAERQRTGFPRSLVAERAGYDIVWFTNPIARGDPCAQIAPATPAGK
jgi:uncharacterized iron-regulated protein